MKFIFVSVSFALWLEFFYKFGATYDPSNFLGACFIYVIYSFFLYLFIRKFLFQKLFLLWVISGTVGLMAEWFLMGNSPWSNPHAIQLGMFVFHAFYPAFALMVLRIAELKKVVKIVMGIFLFFTLLSGSGFLISDVDLRFAWFIWVPLLPYFCSTLIILRCFRR